MWRWRWRARDTRLIYFVFASNHFATNNFMLLHDWTDGWDIGGHFICWNPSERTIKQNNNKTRRRKIVLGFFVCCWWRSMHTRTHTYTYTSRSKVHAEHRTLSGLVWPKERLFKLCITRLNGDDRRGAGREKCKLSICHWNDVSPVFTVNGQIGLLGAGGQK